MLLPVVRLKIRRTSAHPWIFRKMTRAPRFPLEPGSLVRVVDRDGREQGAAFYHPDNTIALRMLDSAPGQAIDAAFFHERLARAIARRREARLDDVADGYRLVNAEGDGLPALVIDRYADILVIEPYAAGWLHIMDWIVDGLRALHPGATVTLRADARVEEKDGLSFAKAAKRWPAPTTGGLIRENGLAYGVDFATGHKTGFFFDQRDNRRRVRDIARDREVFDGCCYTGGFSLSAALGGARSVRGVDLDERAVAQAVANLEHNRATLARPGYVEFVHADVYDALRAAPPTSADLVILDPPKFAEGAGEVDAALARYGDLNRLGMRILRDGGWLVTCSCSGAVPAERWLKTVRLAAKAARTRLREEPLAGPGVDHPVSPVFPEGRYLKVLFARVSR